MVDQPPERVKLQEYSSVNRSKVNNHSNRCQQIRVRGGAVCQDLRIGGTWSESESQYHINILEILAITYAVKSFLRQK